jgi:hypothetical protein
VTHALRHHLATTALGGLADFFGPQSTRFISATDDTKDGVTLAITISGLAQVSALRGALAGQAATTPPAAPGTKPTVTVEVTPGFAHG